MPSQHGATQWAEKEAKKFARMSAEIVKEAIPSKIFDKSPNLMTIPLADRPPVLADIEIPEVVQIGTTMTKISEKHAQKSVLFRIDPDEGEILYKSNKGGIVPIECIKELRTGRNARYYREQFRLPEELEERWITIIYILDGTYKTLHMVAESKEVFDLWVAALQKLYAIRQGLMAGLGNVDMRQIVWERQYWKGADDEGDHVLDFDDIERLVRRLNVNMSSVDLLKLFKEIDNQNRGHLDFSQFQQFSKILKRRPELEGIYAKLSTANGGKFDSTAFVKFMKEFQKSRLNDAELTSLFVKYSGTTYPPPLISVTAALPEVKSESPLAASELPAVASDSPPDVPAPPSAVLALPNEPVEVMSLEGFTAFLSSPDNSPFLEQNLGIWQDMTAPISDYYISSSHNTYLVGHQLVGVSTIEGYIRALLHSCRSVELDIYDGEKEPVIYHGNTLTSKVSLRDICYAIAKYGFTASPYPVLISAEVHCGVGQQDKIVDIMIEVFGDAIIQAPVDNRPKIEALPSPEQLKGKFLLKAKNLYVVEQLAAAQAARSKTPALPKPELIEADTSSPSSSENEAEILLKEGITDLKNKWKKLRGKDKDPAKAAGKKVMSFRLASLLVYTVGVKCHGVDPSVEYAPEHIFSLSEKSANRLMKVETSVKDLMKHNNTHLVRIYPKGTRVNSTNYEPHRYWAAGCQVVAINWQTFDLGYTINQAMFQRNGKSGYVLKPEALRSPDTNNDDLLSKRTRHFLDITIISAQQVPRPRDSRGQEIIEKSIVDPFVEVSLHIPEWSSSPFLPDSATAAGANYSPPTDATTTSVSSARTVWFRTPSIKNNGFNPVWQEELCIPFDCVGDMRDLIFVEFAIRQEGKDRSDEALGIYCVPLGCLEHGS